MDHRSTVENVGTDLPKKIGHRYQPGHPHYPRWRVGSRSQATVFKRRSAKILREIMDERDNELSATQLIHARNAADLGAAIMELNDKRKAGEFVDPISVSNLVNAQRRSLEELDR
jgi:hypothetical protein